MNVLASYVTLGFIAALGATVIYLVWIRKIDLSRLISEPNGDASMSRFQLLIFTFVVASCLFMVVAQNGEFPDIPQGVLLLLGISATSYLVSKGIQFSAAEGVEDRPPMITVAPATARTSIGGQHVQLKATVIRSQNQEIHWSIDPPAYGTVDQNGVYSPPSTAPEGISMPIHVTIRATSASDPAASSTCTITLA